MDGRPGIRGVRRPSLACPHRDRQGLPREIIEGARTSIWWGSLRNEWPREGAGRGEVGDAGEGGMASLPFDGRCLRRRRCHVRVMRVGGAGVDMAKMRAVMAMVSDGDQATTASLTFVHV